MVQPKRSTTAKSSKPAVTVEERATETNDEDGEGDDDGDSVTSGAGVMAKPTQMETQALIANMTVAIRNSCTMDMVTDKGHPMHLHLRFIALSSFKVLTNKLRKEDKWDPVECYNWIIENDAESIWNFMEMAVDTHLNQSIHAQDASLWEPTAEELLKAKEMLMELPEWCILLWSVDDKDARRTGRFANIRALQDKETQIRTRLVDLFGTELGGQIEFDPNEFNDGDDVPPMNTVTEIAELVSQQRFDIKLMRTALMHMGLQTVANSIGCAERVINSRNMTPSQRATMDLLPDILKSRPPRTPSHLIPSKNKKSAYDDPRMAETHEALDDLKHSFMMADPSLNDPQNPKTTWLKLDPEVRAKMLRAVFETVNIHPFDAWTLKFGECSRHTCFV